MDEQPSEPDDQLPAPPSPAHKPSTHEPPAHLPPGIAPPPSFSSTPVEQVPAQQQPPQQPVSPSPPAQGNQPWPGAHRIAYISNPFKLFRPSWEAFKINFITWLLLLLVWMGIILGFSLVIGVFVGIMMFVHNPAGTAISIVLMVAAIIGLVVLVVPRFLGAGTVLILASARGQEMDLKAALRTGRPFGWRLFGFSFLYLLMLMVGFLLFIVPGFLVLVWYGFTPFVMVDENLSTGAAMSRSKQLVKGRFWEIYSLNAMSYIISLLNLIPFIGGIIAFVVDLFYAFALPVRYVMLKAHRDTNTELPPVSGVNYALPIIQVIMIVLVILLFVFLLIGGVFNAVQESGGSSSQTSSSPGLRVSGSPVNSLEQGGNSVSLAPGEQLSRPPAHRPSQYLHSCQSTDGVVYVSQGSPSCLPGDTFQFDYAPTVPGTTYSTPCVTTSGSLLRYVYIANNESCPASTVPAN